MKAIVADIPRISLGRVPILEPYEGLVRFQQDHSLIWGAVGHKSANDTQQHFLYGCHFNDNFQTHRFVCAITPMEDAYHSQDLATLFYHPVSEHATYFILETEQSTDDKTFPLPAWGMKIPEIARFNRSKSSLNTYFSSHQGDPGYTSRASPESIAADFLLRMNSMHKPTQPVTLEEKLS